MPLINAVWQFNKVLAEGQFAFPGGYPMYFLCADGEALSWKAAQENAGLIRDAIINKGADTQWEVIGYDINWEDPALFCAHSNERIESAYAEDKKDNDPPAEPA